MNDESLEDIQRRDSMPSVQMPHGKFYEFEKKLQELINYYSLENDSNTPDFILAKYLVGCLQDYNVACKENSKWHTSTNKY